VPNYFNEAELINKCKWVEEIIVGESLNEVSSSLQSSVILGS
jgi:hypothetical protein